MWLFAWNQFLGGPIISGLVTKSKGAAWRAQVRVELGQGDKRGAERARVVLKPVLRYNFLARASPHNKKSYPASIPLYFIIRNNILILRRHGDQLIRKTAVTERGRPLTRRRIKKLRVSSVGCHRKKRFLMMKIVRQGAGFLSFYSNLFFLPFFFSLSLLRSLHLP